MAEGANLATKEKKDKKKVIGEAFTEEMLVAYLSYEPVSTVQKEFDILLRAYRGLPEAAFSEFIGLYQEKGYDINAKNKEGVTFVAFIRQYPSFPAYVKILEQAGATVLSE